MQLTRAQTGPAIFIALLLLALSPQEAAAQETQVDLELALAVDASASVDDAEYRLQLEGIAYGFRDAAVQAAIGRGDLGRIAVNLIIWAEAGVPPDMTGWHVLAEPAEIEAFAALIATLPRRLTGGTGLGEGVAQAIASFDRNDIASARRVVDVSGDGEETTPREFVVQAVQARAMARARGITVNGLAVLNETPDLDRWYRRFVQSGANSFVMAVTSFEDFADAMQRKLLREIEPLPQMSKRDAFRRRAATPARPRARAARSDGATESRCPRRPGSTPESG